MPAARGADHDRLLAMLVRRDGVEATGGVIPIGSSSDRTPRPRCHDDHAGLGMLPSPRRTSADPIVVHDAVGDRVPGVVEWNLYDIDAKFGDVEPLEHVLDHLDRTEPFTSRIAAQPAAAPVG